MSDTDPVTDPGDDGSTPDPSDGSTPDPDDDPDGEWNDGDDREWKFTKADFEDPEPPQREPIEPGDPSFENALFVTLGAVGTVVLLATAVVPGIL